MSRATKADTVAPTDTSQDWMTQKCGFTSDHLPQVLTVNHPNGKPKYKFMTWNMMKRETTESGTRSRGGGYPFSMNPYGESERSNPKYQSRLDAQVEFLGSLQSQDFDFLTLQEPDGFFGQYAFRVKNDDGSLGESYGDILLERLNRDNPGKYVPISMDAEGSTRTTAIIFNTQKFSSGRSGGILPRKKPTDPNPSMNSGFVGQFTDKASGEKLVVGSAHCIYDLRYEESFRDFAFKSLKGSADKVVGVRSLQRPSAAEEKKADLVVIGMDSNCPKSLEQEGMRFLTGDSRIPTCFDCEKSSAGVSDFTKMTVAHHENPRLVKHYDGFVVAATGVCMFSEGSFLNVTCDDTTGKATVKNNQLTQLRPHKSLPGMPWDRTRKILFELDQIPVSENSAERAQLVNFMAMAVLQQGVNMKESLDAGEMKKFGKEVEARVNELSRSPVDRFETPGFVIKYLKQRSELIAQEEAGGKKFDLTAFNAAFAAAEELRPSLSPAKQMVSIPQISNIQAIGFITGAVEIGIANSSTATGASGDECALSLGFKDGTKKSCGKAEILRVLEVVRPGMLEGKHDTFWADLLKEVRAAEVAAIQASKALAATAAQGKRS